MAAIIAVVVVVLATGGQTPSTGTDAAGDVSVEGDGAPVDDPNAADIASADVRRGKGGDVFFVAEMAGVIPQRIPNGSLELRWDLLQDGNEVWFVSATVTNRVVAAVTSQVSSYGASTIDDTLPGSVQVVGTMLTIRLQAGNIEDFPSGFEWRLRTTLDRDRADPSSSLARDQAPDGGPGRLEE